MRRLILSGVVATAVAAALVTACSGDDTSVPVPLSDGGADATAHPDGASGSDGAVDGGSAPDAASDAQVDAGPQPIPGPPYALVTYAFGGYASNAFAAVSIPEGKLARKVALTGFGTHVNGATHPWVLNQEKDVVFEMDPVQPWKVISSWSVALPKSNDAGAPYSNAYSVAEVNGKAYVAFFNRNAIAVLDATTGADGGAPAKVIDVSKWHQADDSDGYIDAVSAVYVAAENRLYVVMANIDLNNVDPAGFFQLCGTSKAAVGAIDLTTDAIVDLGDPAVAKGAIPLAGVSPASVAYDAKNKRLLVVSSGCNEKRAADAGADAGIGPVTGRLIEEVTLADKKTRVLFEAAGKQGYPGPFQYIDETHALVGFGGITYAWDPTSAVLGASIDNAPDGFAYDGTGAIVGPRTNRLADGGASVDLVSVQLADGGVKVLGANPFGTTPDGYSAVTIWPKP